MQPFHTRSQLEFALQQHRENGRSIGFVPTMGALHQGHLDLIARAQEVCDFTVVSIFVNPTQFNSSVDLERYPRDAQRDLELLDKQGVNYAFLPTEAEVYPDGVASANFDLGGLDTRLEGAFRPGHFQGVATVVKRLFEIVQPHFAFFGEKDYQQLLVIKKLVQLEQMPIQIVGVETQRAISGLALSSRNNLLSDAWKEKSAELYACLQWAVEHTELYSPSEIEAAIEMRLKQTELELEYVRIADAENLQPIERFEPGTQARIFIAAYANGVRLIDNVSLF